MLKLNYLKAIADNSISIADLPEDIQIGIKSIKGIERAINMQEKKGANTEKAIKKVEREDRIVTAQINDFLKEKNPKKKADDDSEAAEKERLRLQAEKEEKEKKDKEELEQKKKKEADNKKIDPRGTQIDKELAAIVKSDKTVLTAEELKAIAPTAYSMIFESYEKGSENGLETSYYKCIETEPEKFTTSKI